MLSFSTLGFSAATRFGLLAVLFLAACSGGVGPDPFPEREVTPPPPKEIGSDDFHTGALNTELWEVVDPRGDGTVAFEGAGTSDARLLLSVPSGTTHDPWSTNTALRVMQAAADEDFEIEAKFESEPTEKFQGQGLLVEQDESNFIRFDVYSDATSFRVFSAQISNGSPLVTVNDAIASAATIHLRLRRTGDRWTAQYSYRGSNWVPAIAFSHPLEVSSVGVFASNDDPNPAYTAVVDYFFNTASPVIPEDTTRFCGDGLITPPETCEPPGTATCHDFCRARPPSCGDGFINGAEACDDGNTANGDGCASDCSTEIVAVCGDGMVTVPETCEPPGTEICNDFCTDRVPVCGDGYLTGTETCDDGNVVSGDGCSGVCVLEFCGDGIVNNSGTEQCDDGNTNDGDGCAFDCTFEGGTDLTQAGTIIARITEPRGSGNKDPEVIRDGDKPPVGDRSRTRQYDTYSGGAFAAEDWIGYEYTSEQLFGQVVFQEGRNFSDGGFFLDVTVQVRQGGLWFEAPGVTITPVYAGDDGISYHTYVFDFDPVLGDAIRIHGAPGGTKYFISVGELEVFALP